MPSRAALLSSDPTDLNAFYAKHPEFLICPLLIAAVLVYGCSCSSEMWGVGALQYVGTSLLLQFALHGFVVCYQRELGKLQPTPLVHSPAGVATRQSAVLLSNLVYMLLPMRPCSSSWASFAGWCVALALFWDAYFFVAHREFHKRPKLYRLIHKRHHAISDPMVFTAYYVEYISHFLTEQLVVIAAAFILPRDCLTSYLYFALVDTYLQHAGVDVDPIRLPLAPFLTVGHVRALLSLHSLPFGAYTTAHHDLHHEKNEKNYALAFTYLDRIAGTHHDGRTTTTASAAPAAPKAEPLAERTPMPPRLHSRQLSGG